MKFLNVIKTSAVRSSRKIKAKGPTIGIVVGLGCCAASTVVGVIHALRVEKIKDKYGKQLATIENDILECCDENGAVMAEYVEDAVILEERAKKLKIKCFIAIIAGFVPSAFLLASGGACIITSHRSMIKRHAALGAAYAALDRGYREYQKRVEEKLGKDEADKVKFKAKDDEGVEAIVNGKEKYMVDSKLGYSPYARFFDETHPTWSKNHRDNVRFLRLVFDAANRRLEEKGYLFLNDVLDWLGYPKTVAGQRVGWVRTSRPEKQVGDAFVSFGVNPYDIELATDSGRESWILDFNVVDITDAVFESIY